MNEETIRQVIIVGVAILLTFVLTKVITLRSFCKKVAKLRNERDSMKERYEKAKEEIRIWKEEQGRTTDITARLVEGPFEIEDGGKILSDNAFSSRCDGKLMVYPKESITRTGNNMIVVSHEDKKAGRKMEFYKYVGSFNGMNLGPKKQ